MEDSEKEVVFNTCQETFTLSVPVISIFLFDTPPREEWECRWAVEMGCSAPDIGGRFKAYNKTMSQARTRCIFMKDSLRTPETCIQAGQWRPHQASQFSDIPAKAWKPQNIFWNHECPKLYKGYRYCQAFPGLQKNLLLAWDKVQKIWIIPEQMSNICIYWWNKSGLGQSVYTSALLISLSLKGYHKFGL